MSLTRSAAILLATFVLLWATGTASAASSRLTPMPPVALPNGPAPRAPAPPPSPPAQSTGAIPRTGADVRLEVLAAALLITAGGLLRARLPAGRA